MKRIWTIWRSVALLLLIGLLAGCNSGSPAPQTPGHTSTPMVRVTIQLDDVYCNGKQSVWPWQRDLFYIMTTFSASGPTPTSAVVTQSQISDPVSIGNNQDLAIPPGPLVVFNALLPLDGTIRGGFTAFNGGVTSDQIAQFASWAGPIAEKVSGQLQEESIDSGNLYLIAGAVILNLAVHVFFGQLNWTDNNSNQLGKQAIEITANGPQVDPETLNFVQNSGPSGTWNYLIRYTITRTFTSGTN